MITPQAFGAVVRVMSIAAIVSVSQPRSAPSQTPRGLDGLATTRQPPACSEPGAGQHRVTVDDVVMLRGEGLARVNPFGAFDVDRADKRIAVQIHHRLSDIRAHATSTFFWLHADVGVYDMANARQIGYLDAKNGDSWGAPFWSPSGHYLAVTHVGPASLDREIYLWEVGKAQPKQLVSGALAGSLRLATGTPNGRAGAYAWIDSVNMLVATVPAGTGTLDMDDAMAQWPRLWSNAAGGGKSAPSVIDAHLPSSVPPAHANLGVPLTLSKINVRTGARKTLVTIPAIRGRTPRDILISQDAQWVAFTPDVRPIDPSAGPVPPLNRAETELLLVNLVDGRVLHPLPGRHAILTRWSSDDATIGVRLAGDTVIQIRKDGTVDRSASPVISPATRAVARPESSAPGAPPRARVVTRVDGTGEHLLIARGNDTVKVLTVDESVSKLAVCRPWNIRYATRSGDTVYARVTMPPGFVSGKRYPVLAQIYPGTVHTRGEALGDTLPYVKMSTSWEPSLFAAHGYVVVEPSIPLSGVGADHAKEFAGDILPAIDSLVAFGVADPERLAIDGVSFGGYGTAMTIEQTNRFKAAIARNGLYDLASMYGQFGPPRRLADDAGEWLWAPGWAEGGQGHLGAPPYGHWDLYRDASPLTHVDTINTPVLIVAGDMDYAAPLAQSEELFTALNRLGKPVRFIRYPGEGHGNASAADLRHLIGQMTAWLDAWLAPR
jgi:dipeptidyl aminopeptidase/acylaminoacyl peptidase